MTCIYTGALVRLENYNLQASADVFEVDRVLVIRFSGDPQQNPMAFQDNRPPTHIVREMTFDRNHWTRLDLGVIVVERWLVEKAPGHREYVKAEADGSRHF